MTTTTTNGRARPSLAAQIDRLDAILDGLAENLNAAVVDAVAGAVKEAVTVAVQEAVHAAVLEVLTNAELRKRLGAAQAPASQPSVPVTVRLGHAARRCWGWLVGAATAVWGTARAVARTATRKAVGAAHHAVAEVPARAQEVCETVAVTARKTWLVVLALAALARRYRKQVLAALVVGALVGVSCYVGGREIASLGCALAGFAGSLLASAARRLRKVLPLLAGNAS